MGKCETYVHDHFQIFTHIRGPEVRKMCKISTIQLTANKGYGQKTEWQEEPWEDFSQLAPNVRNLGAKQIFRSQTTTLVHYLEAFYILQLL